MKPIAINKNNFEEIKKNNKAILIDFYADWCGPCKMFAPVFEELAGDVNDVVFCKVNVDNEEALARKFGVMSIPTVIVLKDGNQVAQNVGLAGKQKILAMINA